jgi:hypothetical protein
VPRYAPNGYSIVQLAGTNTIQTHFLTDRILHNVSTIIHYRLPVIIEQLCVQLCKSEKIPLQQQKNNLKFLPYITCSTVVLAMLQPSCDCVGSPTQSFATAFSDKIHKFQTGLLSNHAGTSLHVPPPFQSVYNKCHSTETALLSIHDHVIKAMSFTKFLVSLFLTCLLLLTLLIILFFLNVSLLGLVSLLQRYLG